MMRVRFDAYSFARVLARSLNICEYLKGPLKIKKKSKMLKRPWEAVLQKISPTLRFLSCLWKKRAQITDAVKPALIGEWQNTRISDTAIRSAIRTSIEGWLRL